ncbi:hypothetical protein HX005_14130 [Acinetobacter sp. R933-2]|uniref:BRO-N domain-containing protein n=1 Tax=Acinetobacter sp. R933-2 TaxID=2746728 RepID=UPI0025781D6B|nr:Bro-N domain-containing protein [Acinetobacter sp. R933-2]MDM1248529.1 hypothetical protein [Acinetobacter sp. R933-2]
MSILALSFNDVNFSPVQQNGQIWITGSELANALGYARVDSLNKVYERNSDEFDHTMTQVIDISQSVNLTFSNLTSKTRIFSLRGCHLIAIFARTAIAKQFRRWVLDILDKETLSQKINSQQTISPTQQSELQTIVAKRAGNCGKARMEMWSRHNNHFKIGKYIQLLAIHFDDAKFYLENMQIKAKLEHQEVKTLPYPHEVIQVAQQINYEYNGGQYHSWFVHVRDDGQLSAMPLLKGYYPINLAEFSKKFDGLLDFVYGSELLTTGRYLASK